MYLPADDFDYLKLMALGRSGPAPVERATRVALLGFCTTSYYAKVLRGIGTAAGFPITTFESEYNTVEQTLLDELSTLYDFKPQAIIFVTAVQTLRDRLLAVELAQRSEAAESEAAALVSQIKRAARLPGVTVIVHELVIPYERAWGNFSSRIEGSLGNVVTQINARLRALAKVLPNVFTLNCDHIAAWLGKKLWFDERLWFYSKSFCHPEALPLVAGQALDIIRAVQGKVLKCVALDLDNTLWGGVIGDDGLQGIRLGDLGDGEAYVRFQRWLKELAARGILLAVCSKNDEARARAPFQNHADMVLREADLACFIANWDNKADNLRQLAKRLNIGLDAVVFLDDAPFERNLVRQLVPEVCVPEMPDDPAEFVPYLESLNLFEATQVSAEDRQRTEFYKANALREEEQSKFADVNDYLVSLKMTAAFERFDDDHLPRISQLVERTNQFNLTTIRHSAAELKTLAQDAGYFPFFVTLEDRFGDNGLISVVIGKRAGQKLEIVTWLMSCRVISRRLEEFVLARLIEVAQNAGLQSLFGKYEPTPKNEIVAGHYERLGFKPTGTAGVWELPLAAYVPTDIPIYWKRKP
jgi:FkbH-like protein